jgi:hypothetical protein
MTAAAAVPAAVAQKALGSKLSSMQILLLTAMTLLGFYLCFTEIRRLNTEVASIRDRLVESSAKTTGDAASQAPSAAPQVPAPACAGGGAVVAPKATAAQVAEQYFDDDDDDEEAAFMDEGLRQMLEQLQRAAMPPPQHAPVATVEEVEVDEKEEEEEAAAAISPPAPPPTEEETLMTKSKAEIEELLKQAGIPYKKSDSKAKLAHSLLQGRNSTEETE